MVDPEKMELDLLKANNELKQIMNSWDFPTKRIMNWLTTGDPKDNSWDKEWNKRVVGKQDNSKNELNKIFNNY